MKKLAAIVVIALLLIPARAFGEELVAEELSHAYRDGFSIPILAMLLLGFGFLMVLARKHGHGATAGTYLVVATGIPLYLLLRSWGGLSAERVAPLDTKALVLAEFACVAALVAMGAVLGRLRLHQYALLAALVIPAYALNEWLVAEGGLEATRGFVDPAGSIIVHAFGAYFGLGLALALTRRSHRTYPTESDQTSERFSMLGSMMLWVFWPCISSALVPAVEASRSTVTTILALCGSTLAAYFTSVLLRNGRLSFADLSHAALAGGVAIGASSHLVSPLGAFAVGLFAGTLCVVGYVGIQPRLDAALHIVDTCGVHNLHGLPGLVGGLMAALVVPDLAKAELAGIAFTVLFAFLCGTASGYLLTLSGRQQAIYDDGDEFLRHRAFRDDENVRAALPSLSSSL